MAKVDEAYQYMVNLIDGGAEYPDAEFNAARKFKLKPREVTEMQEMYDSEGMEEGGYSYDMMNRIAGR